MSYFKSKRIERGWSRILRIFADNNKADLILILVMKA